ncbi:ester cyclase [Mycolicibacterium thermoresistibile]
MRPTEIVRAFWDEVWNAHDPDAVERLMADDAVIEAGGQKFAGIESIKDWVKQFLDQVHNLHVEVIQNFPNEDGTQVTSRWILTGDNNGVFGTQPNGKPIALSGLAVWTLTDSKLQRGWIEQSSFETYRSMLA